MEHSTVLGLQLPNVHFLVLSCQICPFILHDNPKKEVLYFQKNVVSCGITILYFISSNMCYACVRQQVWLGLARVYAGNLQLANV